MPIIIIYLSKYSKSNGSNDRVVSELFDVYTKDINSQKFKLMDKY